MGNTHGTHGNSGLTGSSHTGTGYNSGHSTNAGPHSSNAANAMDPRVGKLFMKTSSSKVYSNISQDSDRDGRSGLPGSHNTHATAGSGNAQNTAGPHNSDLLNKLDPRVDSDRDGSKTIGGNKTHQ